MILMSNAKNTLRADFPTITVHYSHEDSFETGAHEFTTTVDYTFAVRFTQTAERFAEWHAEEAAQTAKTKRVRKVKGLPRSVEDRVDYHEDKAAHYSRFPEGAVLKEDTVNCRTKANAEKKASAMAANGWNAEILELVKA